MINMIRWYQKHISCWLEAKNIHCKYYPSCSEYTKQAIEKYGAGKDAFRLTTSAHAGIMYFKKEGD